VREGRVHNRITKPKVKPAARAVSIGRERWKPGAGGNRGKQGVKGRERSVGEDLEAEVDKKRAGRGGRTSDRMGYRASTQRDPNVYSLKKTLKNALIRANSS